MDEQIQNSTKYQDILKTAHDLFWKFGIRRVTVEEVCKEAGASKMTFYRFFSNKQDLAQKVIQEMFEDGINKYRALMAEDIPFEEKIKKQILLKFEGTREISSELVKDIYSGSIPKLKEFWESYANRTLQEVLDNYREAQKKGWIRKDLNIEFIQYYSNKMFETVSDEAAVKLFKSPQDLIMEIMNMFFYGILPHSSQNNE